MKKYRRLIAILFLIMAGSLINQGGKIIGGYDPGLISKAMSETEKEMEVTDMAKTTDRQTVNGVEYLFRDSAARESINELNQKVDNNVALLNQKIDGNIALLNQKVNGNIAFGTDYTYGVYPNPSGSNMISNADYKTTGFIPVQPNTAYYKDTHFGFFHFYSAPDNEHFISGQVIQKKYFTTPENAYYIKAGGEKEKEFELYQALSFVDLLEGVTIYDDTLVHYGAVSTNEGYFSTDYIPVTSPMKIIVDVGLKDGNYFFNGYNYNKQFNGGALATIPLYINNDVGNIAYIRLSFSNQVRDYIKIYGIFAGDEPYGMNADRFLTDYAETIIDLKNSEKRSTEFHIGANQEYTTLKAGISAAYNAGNATVYVHEGEYDLEQEFATEIAAHTESHCGIQLGRNMHVIFYQGAKVKAILEPESYNAETWAWINDHFEPFWVAYADQCNFTIENMVCEMKNTRYCVHDELAGIDVAYIHKFINCTMKYTSSRTENFKYIQCIGGGLGRNGNITVEGGLYESVYTPDGTRKNQTISYHNANNASAYSHIELRNVYAKGKSYFAFGTLGTSTAKSPVLISSCSMEYAPLKDHVSGTDNYELYEFCNEIRTPGHWERESDAWVYVED